jgi:hypothetical protein
MAIFIIVDLCQFNIYFKNTTQQGSANILLFIGKVDTRNNKEKNDNPKQIKHSLC